MIYSTVIAVNKPNYKLTLHKTYYDQGFFNLGVAVDQFVRPDSGEARLKLGEAGVVIDVKVNREANENGTPRVLGGPTLRNWLQSNFNQGDTVIVEIESPIEYSLKAHR